MGTAGAVAGSAGNLPADRVQAFGQLEQKAAGAHPHSVAKLGSSVLATFRVAKPVGFGLPLRRQGRQREIRQRENNLTTNPKYGRSLDDLPEFLNILYYGDPGSGKTSHAAAMAKLGKVYLVDVESGAKAKPLRRLGIPTTNIRPVAMSSYDDLDKLFWQVKQELDTDPDSVAGIIFDSISEIHDQLLREQVDKRHAKALRKATGKDGELLMEVDDNEFLIELPERGIVTEQLRTLTRKFRDLPCHTAFVALAKREVDQDGGGVVYLPQLPPKYGGNLRGFVDIVVYCTQADGIDNPSGFLGVCREIGKFKGKDRLGGTLPVTAYPSFDRIVDAVFNDFDLSEDEHQMAYSGRVRAAVPQNEPEKAQESAPAE